MTDINIKDKNNKELENLAEEIREFLIQNISKTGGHLASNLGVVEITLALHKVFDFNKDSIIFDVGHQSYVHKYLTGRKDKFSTLRQLDGLSGFPKVSEDERDTFDSGHASNSISIGMGIAEAKKNLNKDDKTIVLIGDGALSGGLSYEGLNNVGSKKTPLIIILNDNQYSISKNSGYITNHLRKLRVSLSYLMIKNFIKKTSVKIPLIGKFLFVFFLKVRNYIRKRFLSDSLFELLGLKYSGPYDAHNISELVKIFNNLKDETGPVVIHLISKKGKGYRKAEKNPEGFHGTGSFNVSTGQKNNVNTRKSFSEIYGNLITSFAFSDERIICVTAAMTKGTGLDYFSSEFPNRFFDTGIAESHAVSFANGLSLKGMRPFVSIYSSFMQRAYDNILIESCLMKLPVTFILDRSGLVGEDGETHNGLFDISYLNTMPNINVYSPATGSDLRNCIDISLDSNEPIAIRVFKGSPYEDDEFSFLDNKDEGKDYLIIAFGYFLKTADILCDDLKSEGNNVKVLNLLKIKPLDEKSLIESIKKTKNVITLEDNVKSGGIGEKINSLIGKNKINVNVFNFSFPDNFVEHGSIEDLIKRYELDAKSIKKKVL